MTTPIPPPRRIFRFLVTTTLALAVAGGAFATLAAFAGRWWWAFDLVANFRPHLAALGLVVTLLGTAFRRPALAVAAAAATLVNVATIAPLYVPTTATPPADAVHLRVMHHNVLVGNRDHAAVARAMRESDADVIFLQEGMDDAWMSGLLGNTGPYELVANAQVRRYTSGLAMWVRRDASRPVEVVSHRFVLHDETGVGGPMIEATVRVDGVGVAILGLHPPPPMRDARWAERNAGLAFANRWAAAQAAPCVVVGDFNATPWTHGFRLATEGGRLVNSQRGHGLAATWPAQLRHLGAIPIDHCLHSPEITTVARRIGDPAGSDHLPLHVTLAIPRP